MSGPAVHRSSRRRALVLAGFVLAVLPNMATGVSIATGWRVAVGDDPQWAAPDCDDSAWRELAIGDTWSGQVLAGTQGVVWYRKRIARADFPEHSGVLVGPGRSGRYELFANGIFIGSEGFDDRGLPYPRTRAFEIPVNRLSSPDIVLALRYVRVPWASDLAPDALGPVGGRIELGDFRRLQASADAWATAMREVHLPMLILAVIFAIVGLFHLVVPKRADLQAHHLWFAITCLLFGINTFMISNYAVPFIGDYDLALRLIHISAHLVAATAIQFLWPFLGVRISVPLRLYQWINVVVALLIALAPSLQYVLATVNIRFALLVPLLLATLVLLAGRVRAGQREAWVIALGAGCLVVAEFMEVGRLFFDVAWDDVLFLPAFGFLALTISMALSLAARQRHDYDELAILRQDLARQVQARTAEFETTNKKLQGEIEERRRGDHLTTLRNRMLEQYSLGVDTDDLLAALVECAEEYSPGMLVSLMIIEDGRFKRGIAPSLPDTFNDALNGLLVGDGLGSFGTAAFRGERVLSEDIAADPRWSQFRDLAQEAGLHAGWAQPIMSHDHVLGVLAFYYRQTRRPQSDELEAVEVWTRIAGVVIERRLDELKRQELETHLQQAHKMEALGQLAGGVAHDFNNLLTAILGNVEVAQVKAESADTASELLDALSQIKHSGERGASLTQQLLTFCRKDMSPARTIDPARVLKDIETLLGRLLSENVSMSVKVGPAVPVIEARGGHFEQVIINLALNACDAMPRGGRLSIALETQSIGEQGPVPAGTYVLLEVHDTGEGMDEHTVAHMFEPFFTTKPIGAGTGMGLSTVYGIVSQARGHIRVDSRVGTGTTLRIYWPAAETLPEQGRAAGTESEGRTLTVLLCEDETAVRNVARAGLTEAGYHVLSAEDPRRALEAVDRFEGTIDMLIADLVVPEGSGRDLAAVMRRRFPAMPILFISGYPMNVDDKRLREELQAEFLPKPFGPSDLIAKVTTMIRGGEVLS